MKPTDFLGEKVEYNDECVYNLQDDSILIVEVPILWDRYSKESEMFRNDLGQWIADAINEKLEREIK